MLSLCACSVRHPRLLRSVHYDDRHQQVGRLRPGVQHELPPPCHSVHRLRPRRLHRQAGGRHHFQGLGHQRRQDLVPHQRSARHRHLHRKQESGSSISLTAA
jgi:hypothetical protein